MKLSKQLYLGLAGLLCLTGCAPLLEKAKGTAIPQAEAAEVTTSSPSAAISGLASYHYSLSVLFSLNGRIDDAIGELEKALLLDDKSVFLATELAALYGEKGDVKKAILLAEKLAAENDGDTDSHLLLANLYLNNRNLKGAMKEYLRVNELDPRNADSLLYLGILYGEEKNYEKSISSFQKLLNIDADNFMANYYLAKLLSEQSQYGEAESLYKKALAIKPGFEQAVIDLGSIYEKQGKDEQAIVSYRDYIKLNPHSVAVRLQLANLLIKLKKTEEAETELRETLNWGKGNREVGYRLGLFYLENNHYDRSIEILTDFLKNNPTDERLRYLLGSAYEAKKDYQAAMSELQKIPREAELYPNAQVSIAMILKNTDRIDAAIATLSAAITNRKEVADLYVVLSSLYEEKKDLPKAEETLMSGLKTVPSVMLHFNLGVIYEKMGRYEESIGEMKTVLQLDSNNAEAMNFIGYTYADRGINLTEAEALIKKAVELKPGNAYMLDSLGWVYFQLLKLDEAIKYLKEASELLPQDATIVEHLGDAYAKASKISAAIEAYRQAMKLSPENNAVKQKLENLTGKNHE